MTDFHLGHTFVDLAVRRIRLVACLLCCVVAAGCAWRSLDVTFDASPIDDHIVFTARGDGGSDIYSLHLRTGKVTQITATPEFETEPKFTPDGRDILYSSEPSPMAPSNIMRCHAAGGRPRVVTAEVDVYDSSPAMEEGGTNVVFVRATREVKGLPGERGWADWDIYITAGGSPSARRRTNSRFIYASNPEFLPGTGDIIFSGDEGSQASDSVYRLSGGRSATPDLRKLADGSQSSVSRDGSLIAYISDQAKLYDYDVWLMKPDGTHSRQLTANGSYNMCPRFSADGRTVYFLSDPLRSGRCELWSIGIDGGRAKLIARSELFDDPLRWSTTR